MANTAQYSSMSEKKAVKYKYLYSLTDDNVVSVLMEGQCSKFHQFVGSHVSSKQDISELVSPTD